MNIRRSTLLAALASLTTGPLSYTRDYAWSLLSASWRSTGLRQDDLKEALRYCVAEGFLQLHGDEDEALYRLTDDGELALDQSRWFPWTPGASSTRWKSCASAARIRPAASRGAAPAIRRRGSARRKFVAP